MDPVLYRKLFEKDSHDSHNTKTPLEASEIRIFYGNFMG